jgi:hypothetical protein
MILESRLAEESVGQRYQPYSGHDQAMPEAAGEWTHHDLLCCSPLAGDLLSASGRSAL